MSDLIDIATVQEILASNSDSDVGYDKLISRATDEAKAVVIWHMLSRGINLSACLDTTVMQDFLLQNPEVMHYCYNCRAISTNQHENLVIRAITTERHESLHFLLEYPPWTFRILFQAVNYKCPQSMVDKLVAHQIATLSAHEGQTLIRMAVLRDNLTVYRELCDKGWFYEPDADLIQHIAESPLVVQDMIITGQFQPAQHVSALQAVCFKNQCLVILDMVLPYLNSTPEDILREIIRHKFWTAFPLVADYFIRQAMPLDPMIVSIWQLQDAANVGYHEAFDETLQFVLQHPAADFIIDATFADRILSSPDALTIKIFIDACLRQGATNVIKQRLLTCEMRRYLKFKQGVKSGHYLRQLAAEAYWRQSKNNPPPWNKLPVDVRRELFSALRTSANKD